MVDEFGDFEKVETTPTKKPQTNAPGEHVPARVRLPRENQRIGIVQQRLGGNRMDVVCNDGKTRNCRVPGRFKRSMWLRLKDIVLVELWEHDPDKGDLIYKYNPSEANQLRKRGLLTDLSGEF